MIKIMDSMKKAPSQKTHYPVNPSQSLEFGVIVLLRTLLPPPPHCVPAEYGGAELLPRRSAKRAQELLYLQLRRHDAMLIVKFATLRRILENPSLEGPLESDGHTRPWSLLEWKL